MKTNFLRKTKELFTLLIFVFATILNSLAGISPAYAASCAIDTSKEYIIYSKSISWKCLQPADFSGPNCTNINLWDYWEQPAQRWKFIDAGNNYYYIMNVQNGKVMDIEKKSSANNASNILYNKSSGTNQQFKIIDNGNGYYKIQNRNSGLYLDLQDGICENGSKSIQYSSRSNDTQLWSLKAIESSSSSSSEMRSSAEIVANMGVGWNLGNSLDCTASWIYNGTPSQYETSWGNPVTTKAMIDKIKQAGFKTVRIPVSWGQHMGSAPNYTINTAWLNRVEEVVNYCISNDMYVIVNVHHDGSWCVPTYANQSYATDKLQKLWTQIANRFKNYDKHLIFEALNEPRLEGTEYEWTGGTAESRDVVNKLNAAALKTIRATGGNNSSRAVMIPAYAASGMDKTINDLVVPDDDNIIVSLHAYTPYFFSMDPNATASWGSYSDKYALDEEFDRYYNKFVAKGIPVVIGEFGSINKNNTAARAELAGYIVSAANARNMACIWWDNNGVTPNEWENFGLFNRNTLTWYFPEIVTSMINASK